MCESNVLKIPNKKKLCNDYKKLGFERVSSVSSVFIGHGPVMHKQFSR